MKRTAGATRMLVALTTCLAVGAMLSGCADDTDSASGDATTTTAEATTTTTATVGADEVCDDRDALESSITSLKDVDLRAEGTNGLTAALDAVEDDLATLKSTAGDALEPDVEALEDAVGELKTTLADLGDSPDAAGAAAAATAVSAVGTAADGLIDALQSGGCG